MPLVLTWLGLPCAAPPSPLLGALRPIPWVPRVVVILDCFFCLLESAHLRLGAVICAVQVLNGPCMYMQHPHAACGAGVLYILGTLLDFQRVVQCHLYGASGGKGRLWSSLLSRGSLIAAVGFYALLVINCNWVLEWMARLASRRG